MRLIDADRLRKIFEDGECPCKLQYKLLGIVDVQPTAFDADKVVEQLKTKKTRTAALQKASEYFEGETDAFEVAIKIVKGGGVE